MKKRDLTIVIVNWNAGDLLKNCVNSIVQNTKDLDYEIYIVDNNSSDNSIEMVKEEFKYLDNLKIDERNDNNGFAFGNNVAMKDSSSNAVLLLNPDTIVIGDVIEKCYKYLMNDDKLGIVGCTVRNPDKTIQLACRRMVPNPSDAFFKLFGFSKVFKNNKSLSRYNQTHVSEDEFLDVDAVSGCYLMIKREVINKIGYLDSTFFMYGEELDWCYRAKKEGYIVRYCPLGEIIHYKGESSKKRGIKSTYEFYRAMYIFYKKNQSSENNLLVNFIVYMGIYILGFLNVAKAIIFKNGRVGTKG